MRLNKYIAVSTSLSRRAADAAIVDRRVTINGLKALNGQGVEDGDVVCLDGELIQPITTITTIMFHKSAGVVVSRNGQGNETIYSLLPEVYHQLNPVGRLDKESSGLLLLTNDGELANKLTHPSFIKTKVYEVTLNKVLQPLHQQMISDYGVTLDDGPSKLMLSKLGDDGRDWQITMHEGRNRQIRRTFASLGYTVTKLHRTHFGPYALHDLLINQYRELSINSFE